MDIFLMVILALMVVVGSFCGLIAIVKISDLSFRIRQLETDVKLLRKFSSAPSPAPAAVSAPVETKPAPITPPVVSPIVPPTVQTISPEPVTPQPAPAAEPVKPRPAPKPSHLPKPVLASLPSDPLAAEMSLGSRLLNWVGIVLVIFGVAFFLKYTLDNNWLGPVGRVSLGALAGVVSLGLAEWARRRDYDIVYHTLSGGGIAVFYVCIFFAYGYYQLINPFVAYTLSVATTILAIALAVWHNTQALAIIGLLGGYLSPILLSTENANPLSFLLYLTLLDFMALGCAFFRFWMAVNLFSFVGSSLLFLTWLMSDQYTPEWQTTAIIFSTFYFVLFLILPLLHNWLNRMLAGRTNLNLLGSVVFVSLLIDFQIIPDTQIHLLGNVVLLKSILLFGISQLWLSRVPADLRTFNTLLLASVMLLTLVIPLHLDFYAVPIAWAAEAVILAYVAQRYTNTVTAGFSWLTLALSLFGLLGQLPLHNQQFILFFNAPFGSWLFVILCCFLTAYFLYRVDWKEHPTMRKISEYFPLLAGAYALILVLNMELGLFWKYSGWFESGSAIRAAQYSGWVVLWSLILVCVTELLLRYPRQAVVAILFPAAIVGMGLYLQSLVEYLDSTSMPLVNVHYLVRLLMVAALGWISFRLHRFLQKQPLEWRQAVRLEDWMPGVPVLLGIFALIFLLHRDLGYFWEYGDWFLSEVTTQKFQFTSWVALWALFLLTSVEVHSRFTSPLSVSVFYLIGLFSAALYLISLLVSWNASYLPFINIHVLARFLMIGAMAYAVYQLQRKPARIKDDSSLPPSWIEIAAHFFAIALIGVEITVWANSLQSFSPMHKHGIISALWSLYALGLIIAGLQTRSFYRRMLGFALFGVTVSKIFLLDMSLVQAVYRILSFMACGILLIVAGSIYQRYAKIYLAERVKPESPTTPPPTTPNEVESG